MPHEHTAERDHVHAARRADERFQKERHRRREEEQDAQDIREEQEHQN
jgi:hypothetical protein